METTKTFKMTKAFVAVASLALGAAGLAAVQSLQDHFSTTSKITLEIEGPLSPKKVTDIQDSLKNVLALSAPEINGGKTGLKITGHSDDDGVVVGGNNGAFSASLKPGQALEIRFKITGYFAASLDAPSRRMTVPFR